MDANRYFETQERNDEGERSREQEPRQCLHFDCIHCMRAWIRAMSRVRGLSLRVTKA